MKSTVRRIKARFKRSMRLLALLASLSVAFIVAAMKHQTGGNTHGGTTQLVTASKRNVENRSIVGACDSSALKTYAYRLNAPEKSKKQPRPGHWFHFIEFHLPLNFTERSNSFDLGVDSFNLLLLLPKISWISELTPMTRFFLSAAYSAPFVRRDVATAAFPQSITFLSAENSLRGVQGIKSPEIDGDRASIVAKRLRRNMA